MASDFERGIAKTQEAIQRAVAGVKELAQLFSQMIESIMKRKKEMEKAAQGVMAGIPSDTQNLKKLKSLPDTMEQAVKTLNNENKNNLELSKQSLRATQVRGGAVPGHLKDVAQGVKENTESKVNEIYGKNNKLRIEAAKAKEAALDRILQQGKKQDDTQVESPSLPRRRP